MASPTDSPDPGEPYESDRAFAETLFRHRHPQAARLPSKRRMDAFVDEVLGLLFPQHSPDVEATEDRLRARVVAKGGAVEWIQWQSGTAQLLPRLLRGRQSGPVFLTDRRAPARTPALDVCPITGRSRLSYRRAAELFTEATCGLDPTGAGWTLHQLRHSDLTHEAEDSASTPMLLARSRHASVRSLERYARPGVDAVGTYVARRDPAARRRHPGIRSDV
jgi:hypothetical protein